MDYSLKTLNGKINFSNLTLTDFINLLNVIGFEIDAVSYSFYDQSNLSSDICIDVKIPANREDLLSERNFIRELLFIFSLNDISIWEYFGKRYFYLLQQRYKKYINYKVTSISSNLPSFITYGIELNEYRNFSSPIWMQKKLLSLGIVPKKDIEDILELVNYEWGQSFQLISKDEEESLKIKEINSKTQSEEATADKNMDFSIIQKKNFALVTDKDQIVSLLGLKQISKIDLSTQENISNKVLISFFYDIKEDKLNLLNFLSKNSRRNLEKEFVQNFKYSFQRALTLLEILSTISAGLKIYKSEYKGLKSKNFRILKLNLIFLKKILNLDYVNSKIFEQMGLKIICKTISQFYLSIPYYRKDLNRQIDLVEEYSKYIGYKNFREILPKKNSLSTHFSNKMKTYQRNRKLIENFFLINGFTEIITNSLLLGSDLLFEKKKQIKIDNPINLELNSLRTNLISTLVKKLQSNLTNSFEKNQKFFEIGRSFTVINKNIVESERIAFLFELSDSKLKEINYTEWFLAKGFIESFFSFLGYSTFEVRKMRGYIFPKFYHSSNSTCLFVNNQMIGVFGELDILFKKEFGLKSSIYMAEINFDFLSQNNLSKVKLYEESSRYPGIRKDLSFLFPKKTNFKDIKALLLLNLSNFKNCEFFDLYRQNNTSEDEEIIKVGLRLDFQSTSETLTNQIVEEELIKIRKLFEEKLSAKFI